uniref:Uncharacterized protein n=1 Tax=Romanomermis culicivorax TaxID=13658 RepID=A0A915L442_ROMCU
MSRYQLGYQLFPNLIIITTKYGWKTYHNNGRNFGQVNSSRMRQMPHLGRRKWSAVETDHPIIVAVAVQRRLHHCRPTNIRWRRWRILSGRRRFDQFLINRVIIGR